MDTMNRPEKLPYIPRYAYTFPTTDAVNYLLDKVEEQQGEIDALRAIIKEMNSVPSKPKASPKKKASAKK